MSTKDFNEFIEGVPVFRTGYNYDRMFVSEATGLLCADPSRTDQSFREECDINTLLRRFNLGMDIPANWEGISGDFTEALDFKSSLDAVRAAEDAFMSLPAEVRSRFQNNPGELISWIEKEENRAEAERMGLLKKPTPAPEPVLVKIQPEAAQ